MRRGSFSENVAPFADLTEMTSSGRSSGTSATGIAIPAGTTPPYGSQYSPNNYFLHSDASGRFSMLPWGTDQTWSTFPFATASTTASALMFTKCLADPTCAVLYGDAVAKVASTIPALDLDELADATAELLRSWQGMDPRKEQTLAQIDDAVAVVHDFIAARPAQAAAWLSQRPVVTGVADRAPNDAGWYNAPVTIDWQATDAAGPASDPPNTVAATNGANLTYTSGPSCYATWFCATGSLASASTPSPPRWRRRSARQRSCCMGRQRPRPMRRTRPPASRVSAATRPIRAASACTR